MAAIGATLPGATSQRAEPRHDQSGGAEGEVSGLLHSVFDQTDAESLAPQCGRVIDALADRLPTVAYHLEGSRPDLLAFSAFPKAI